MDMIVEGLTNGTTLPPSSREDLVEWTRHAFLNILPPPEMICNAWRHGHYKWLPT
jgi:hypothetical protein